MKKDLICVVKQAVKQSARIKERDIMLARIAVKSLLAGNVNMIMLRNNKPKLNREKAKAVILYLLNKCGAMSKEKLGLLLYFVDFDFYEKHEISLTGMTYIKKL